jgi:hypothetical protein
MDVHGRMFDKLLGSDLGNASLVTPPPLEEKNVTKMQLRRRLILEARVT